jgi:hypothetical protein
MLDVGRGQRIDAAPLELISFLVSQHGVARLMVFAEGSPNHRARGFFSDSCVHTVVREEL